MERGKKRCDKRTEYDKKTEYNERMGYDSQTVYDNQRGPDWQTTYRTICGKQGKVDGDDRERSKGEEAGEGYDGQEGEGRELIRSLVVTVCLLLLGKRREGNVTPSWDAFFVHLFSLLFLLLPERLTSGRQGVRSKSGVLYVYLLAVLLVNWKELQKISE